MSVSSGWINVEETVIGLNFQGRWSAEEFYLHIDEFIQTVSARVEAIYLVIDLSYSTTAPENLMTLLRSAMKKMPPNIAEAVIISKSNYWPRVFLMLDSAGLMPFPFKYVYNADEAYALLEEHIY